jgi:hypothetical protein
MKENEYLLVTWDSGALVSISRRHSLLDCNSFVADLVDLVRQFGTPKSVEIKTDKETVGVESHGVRES